MCLLILIGRRLDQRKRKDVDSVAVFKVYSFLNSSMVERTAVNRDVVGSSPTWGARIFYVRTICFRSFSSVG